MLKKPIMVVLLSCLVLFTSGCLEKNNLEQARIYTTVYPISYFTDVLYGAHSTISSIYPDGANINDYALTDKQKSEYSKSDLFIYNGQTDEKQIAKDFSNANKHLQIIDVTYGLKYKYGVEELWLSPSNALMLASNIRTNLENLISSKFINEEILKNYKTLEETLSLKDAELRNIARNAARGKAHLIVSSNMLRFLEEYGFQITSLEDNTSEESLNILKRNFNNGTYKYLFILDRDNVAGAIQDLKNSGAQIIVVNTMTTLSDENRKNNDNYLTIMQEFMENVKNAVIE
jgi:zinc transport system substrate-binding protein